jgi:hypothetical protein
MYQHHLADFPNSVVLPLAVGMTKEFGRAPRWSWFVNSLINSA